MPHKYQVVANFTLDDGGDPPEPRAFHRGESFTAEQIDVDGPDGGVVELRLEGGFQAWFDTDCIWPVAEVALVLAGADSCVIRVDDSREDVNALYDEYLLEQGEGAGWDNFAAWLREQSVRVCDLRVVLPRARRTQQEQPEEQAEFIRWRARRDIRLPPMDDNDTDDIVWPAGQVWRAAELPDRSTPRQIALLLRANRATILVDNDAVEEIRVVGLPPTPTYGGDQEAE